MNVVLADLHRRHPGLTEHLAGSYAEAAHVCLSDHHHSPVDVAVEDRTSGATSSMTVDWAGPSQREQDAWANRLDAIRDGAYSLVLAGVEIQLDLVAVGRAIPGTGADYVVARWSDVVNAADGQLDLEGAFRLEVSGTGSLDAGEVDSRLAEKVKQARKGRSTIPRSIAGVVSFPHCRVALQAAT